MPRFVSNHLGFFLLPFTLIYLASKVFFSLDFTDEMQYYGQIHSLVLNNKLFAGDLFFQQSVYLAFFPVFKLFHTLNPDFSYFVLFGRFIYSLLILITTWAFLNLMNSFYVSRNIKLIACSLLIAILSHRIFGISYNTVSYCLVIIILSLWFRKDKEFNLKIVSLCGALLTITYPPIGIALIGILCSMLIFKAKYKLALAFGGGAVLWFILIVGASFLLGVIEYRGVLDAIRFSRNFGNVGSVQMTGLAGLGLLGFVFTVVMANYFMAKKTFSKFDGVIFNKLTRKLVLTIGFILVLVSSFHPQYWKLTPILIFLITIYFGISSQVTKISHGEFFTFMNIGALVGLVYALSSGDGFYQLPYGVLLLVPFLLFSLKIPENLASQETAVGARHETRRVTALGVAWVLTLIYLSLGNPYREHPIYKLNSFIEGVPAFKGIYTTSIKNNMVNHIIEMAKENDIEPESSMLVVGPNPWIYFATKATPKTPMFYMHFSGSGGVYEFLEKRLEGEAPDWVIYTGTLVDYTGLQSKSLKKFLRGITSGNDYECRKGRFDPDLVKKYNPKPVYAIANPIDICKKIGISSDLRTSKREI